MEGEKDIATSNSSVKWFSELSINSKEIAGEKASYLAEAYNKKNFSKNVDIPAGFVVTKDAIESFMIKGNIRNAISNIFSETDKNNNDELKVASSKIKNLIMKTQFSTELEEEISEAYEALGEGDLGIGEGLAYNILSNATEPAFVAVRASYRNELGDSYFNIKGKANIIYSIKRIIASLFNPEAILEEINSGIKPEGISTAIIIQKMVQADKSGIVYSGDNIVVNAIWGLGGGLKLDEVEADKYVAERSFRIIGKEINEKRYAITRESSGSLKLIGLKEGYSFMQVLAEHEVQELCNILLRLDDIFSSRMQFEFAIIDSEISIVKIEKVKKSQSDFVLSENEIKESPIVEKTEEIEVAIPTPKEVLPLEKESIIKIKETPAKEIITQTKIDVLISGNSLGENANPTKVRSGLLTLENIIKARGMHPSQYIENFNTKGYGEVIFAGLEMDAKNLNEIWVRLSDFTYEDFKDLEGAKEKNEINPIMGLNGIRYLLTNPELLKRELKAISKLKNEDNVVGVVIPKISSVYELKKVKEIIESLDVKMKVGIVLETPASIQLIKDFIEDGIDSVVFAGDTLTEYLLAIDSKNPETYKFYDDTNPALMYQLEYVIRVCNRKDVKTSFMGSATNKKEMIDYLVKKNINTIIVAPEKFNTTLKLVSDAEEEFIHGTDKEIRQYERTMEKDRQKKELEEFEAIKEEEIKEKIIEDSSLNKNNKDIILPEITPGIIEIKEEELVRDVPKAIELIEEEKKEFLENSKVSKVEPKINSSEELIPKSESLIIHPENMKVEKPDNVEEAIRLIEEHNNAPAPLSGVELAMKEIENHNSSQTGENETNIAIEKIKEGNNKIDKFNQKEITVEEIENVNEVISEVESSSPNDELPEFNNSENVDLVNGEEKLEETPEDINAIDETLGKEKLMHDIELIESEKREYLDNEENSIRENSNEETPEDFENALDNNELPEYTESPDNKKDTLGIFG